MIVRMVIYRCRENSNPVTETLAAYVAQTTLNQCKFGTIDHIVAESVLQVQAASIGLWRCFR